MFLLVAFYHQGPELSSICEVLSQSGHENKGISKTLYLFNIYQSERFISHLEHEDHRSPHIISAFKRLILSNGSNGWIVSLPMSWSASFLTTSLWCKVRILRL
ncbi:hypothetical protein PFJ87_02g00860 [Encephalitozoon hellem]|uniref:Uncharacterized protein n=1 Tax=Encephalitozoon hellem TaxID=27973 RepID=A0ABY8CGR2_ENCHE|nr:hypothetical protein PFJ87_02g00860 [Encephalitozoon hellem]